MDIKFLININRFAIENVAELEKTVKDTVIENEKDKANFGNLCVTLKGFRMIADATEAMLYNDGCYKADDGKFYTEVKFEDEELDNARTAKNADRNPKE